MTRVHASTCNPFFYHSRPEVFLMIRDLKFVIKRNISERFPGRLGAVPRTRRMFAARFVHDIYETIGSYRLRFQNSVGFQYLLDSYQSAGGYTTYAFWPIIVAVTIANRTTIFFHRIRWPNTPHPPSASVSNHVHVDRSVTTTA